MFAGNASVQRFVLNNLVIGSIGAAGSLEVSVDVTGTPLVVGSVGIAIPRAAMTGGVGINPVRVTDTNTLTLQFVNGSAAAIDPADTFDFDVFLFTPTGQAQQTI